MQLRATTYPDAAHLREIGHGRLIATAAERNFEPISARIAPIVPIDGRVLEIASGTGQHIAALAQAHPSACWQPSEVEYTRLASINSWRDWLENRGVMNLRSPVELDAAENWPEGLGRFDLIFTVNLFHLVSKSAAARIIENVADRLNERGSFFIYGPFKESGVYRSDGDAAFDEWLRSEIPTIGYKDRLWMLRQFEGVGLRHVRTFEMPANNVALHAQARPSECC